MTMSGPFPPGYEILYYAQQEKEAQKRVLDEVHFPYDEEYSCTKALFIL
jgi:hypothetical protein